MTLRSKTKKRVRRDSFAEQMTAVAKIAKKQGCKTKREVAQFVTGYYFGWGDGLSGKVLK